MLQHLIDKTLLVPVDTARTPTWQWSGDSSLFFDDVLVSSLQEYSDIHSTSCRICFHSSPQSPAQTMLIVERKGMNIPPHLHTNKSDFVYVLDGTMKFFEFLHPDDGSRFHTTLLNQFQGVKPPNQTVHAIGIMSHRCTYLEVSDGPFLGTNDALYPTWADTWHRSFIKSMV